MISRRPTDKNQIIKTGRVCTLAVIILFFASTTAQRASSGLSALPATGHVDERFLSYNVEMAEITGGKFWRPYGSPAPP